jgi:hypothetical protein
MSAIDQITTLLETMTFAEKLSLNERIATSIRKEGGGKAGSKKAKAAKAEGEVKPKRKAAAGTLAWTCFVKHIKATRPDAFAGITKESDKLTVVKGIRAEDMDAYNTFVTEWKANYQASQADAEAEEAESEEEVVAAPAPKASPVTPAMTPQQKIAALKAAKAIATPAPAPAKKEAKKEVKKAAPAKKEVKKAKDEEIQPMPVITINGVDYFHDERTNGLWTKKGDEEFAGDNWVGYYQPGEEEPIRETGEFGSE